MSGYPMFSTFHQTIQGYQQHYNKIKANSIVTNDEKQERIVQESQKQAVVRVLHLASNIALIDCYVNGMSLTKKLKYDQLSPYVPIVGGQYRLDVYSSGTRENALLSVIIPVIDGYRYSFQLVNDEGCLQCIPIFDTTMVPTDEVKMRFMNTSFNGSIDIAVKGGDVLAHGLEWRDMTDFFTLSPMTVDFDVRVAGTKDILTSISNLTLKPNTSYTIYLGERVMLIKDSSTN